MVVHTGDLVEDESNRTQWANANQSMSILLDNGIPYCWEAGNHDYNQTCWIGSEFAAFNPQTFEEKPYWVSSDFGGLDTAVHFNVDGWDCLLVNLAFRANASELSWANSLLDSYPDSHAIVTTHAYLEKDCTYNSWATDFKETVLDTHPNVFLTLSGHFYPTVGNRTRVGDRDELMFNGQDADGRLGAASARILTFDTAREKIDVQTFSLYKNQFLKDPNNNFTLETSFRNDAGGRVVLDFQMVLVLVAVGCLAAFALVYVVRGRFWLGRRGSGRLSGFS